VLAGAGLVSTGAAGGGAARRRIDQAVGSAAAESGVPLLELRGADGIGLEELLVFLTSDGASR
jgi:ABC-2 type transport system ATP-binding protein